MNPELRTRLISGIPLALGALFCTLLHLLSFALMLAVGSVILWREWLRLTAHRSMALVVLGALYIAAALVALIYLRQVSLPILLSVFAIVWGGDTVAYLVGKRWGRHKIIPRISPGKSWEGLAASVLASAAIGAATGHVAPIPHAILGAALALIGFGGDLFESWLKRTEGLKDSGHLIPGHGGLFDRVDSLLPCAIFAAIALYARLHS
jgi:phosphatidate cytidylyltransferase